MPHITEQLKWPDIPERLIKESEALVYINKVQAQFPRLQIFQLSFDLEGYVVVGKCGVLPLKKEKNEQLKTNSNRNTYERQAGCN